MKSFYKAVVNLPLILLLFSFVAIGNEKPLQQYFLNFPPFWQVHSDGSYSGLHYNLAKKLYQHAGLDVEFIQVPYKRMQMQVEQGLVPFINYGEIAEVTTKDILHVCVPPTEITLRIYYTGDAKAKITIPDDLEGKSVVILHGLPLGNYEGLKSNNKIQLIKPHSVEAALKILFIGRGNYLITFDNLVDAQQNNPFSKGELKNHSLYSLLGYPVTTPKTYENGKVLCNKILRSYRQLVKEGVVNGRHGILTSDIKYSDVKASDIKD